MPTAAPVRRRCRSGAGMAGRGRGSGMIGEIGAIEGRSRGSGTGSACAAPCSSVAMATRCRQAPPIFAKKRQDRCFRVRGSVMSGYPGIRGSHTHNADPRHSVRQGRHIGRFPAHLGTGDLHRAIAALRWRPRGLRAPRRRQPVRRRAPHAQARFTDRDRNHLRLRQALGAGARPAADAGIRRRHRPDVLPDHARPSDPAWAT